MAFVFNTATTVNGYLADAHDSLAWLFEVPGEPPDHDGFMAGVSVAVMGSTTYEWLLRHENVMAEPQKWRQFFGDRPSYVFTSRQLETPQGADVRLVRGNVADHLDDIRADGGDGTVWVVGGGDLAGQFLDAGALDEITIQVAPVFLSGGRPLLPRDVFVDRLTLTSVAQVGQFVVIRYAVTHQPGTAGAAG